MGGSMGGKGGAPESPDFMGIAQYQDRAGHANQRTPWASSTWTMQGGGYQPASGGAQPSSGGMSALNAGPGAGIWSPGGGSPAVSSPSIAPGGGGQWSQQVSLDPSLQAANQNLLGQISGQGTAMTGDQARQQAIDSAYGQATSRLDPQWSQRRDSLRQELANAGLDMGSEAYGNAMGDFGRQRNDAYTSAMADAIRQGTAAQAVTYQQNQDALMDPYRRLGAIQGLTGMPGNPGAADYLGAAGAGYNGALNQYATQQAGKNSMMGGAAQLAPLFLMGA